MYHILLDLEATCDKDNKDYPKEIIEIGAVKLDKHFNIVDEFSAFIKPIQKPILTDFCKELTTIKQKDIDRANSFTEVIEEFINWIGDDYNLYSWGMYDKSQFLKDCQLNNIDNSWIKNHTNLKYAFSKQYNVRPCGMKKALNILNIKLDGTHHRGIDDAKNITKIFLRMMEDKK